MAINDLNSDLQNFCSSQLYNRMCLNGFCLGLSLIAFVTLSIVVSRLNQNLIDMRKDIWNAKNQGSSAFTCLQLCGINLSYQQQDDICCIAQEAQDCRLKSQCLTEYIAAKEKEIGTIAAYDQYAIGLQTIMFFVFLMNTYGICYKYKRRDATAMREDQRRNAIMASILIQVQQYVVQVDNKKKILTESFISDQVQQMCAVCLQSFVEQKVIRLKCSHVFHRECIEEWITKQMTCPVCRAVQ